MKREFLMVLITALLSVLTGCDAISPFIGEDLKIAICDRDGDGLARASEYCGGNDCDDGDQNAGEPTDWYRDVDSDTYGAGEAELSCTQPDGFVDHNGDCDDTDELVNPDATEVCNGYDDNCDGNIDDENINVWYADADEDTYGDPNTTLTQCDQPDGYVDNALDCLDTDGTVNPDGTEVCDDGIDQDCNNIVDDADGSQTWYADIDGDGYGDADNTLDTCVESPEGYVQDATDCDDSVYDTSPAAFEACGDGIDNDCDDIIDDDAEDVPWYRDADEDGYGDPNEAQTNCAPPSGYVGNAQDCDDIDTEVNPGVEEVCNNGVDDNCDDSSEDCRIVGALSTVDAEASYRSESTNSYASTNVAMGDVDGDGVLDVVIGVPRDDTAASDAGAVYIFLSPTSGTYVLTDADFLVTGANASDYFGSTLAVGDADGDGNADLLVGAPGTDMPSANVGSVALFLGPFAGDREYTDADMTIRGSEANGEIGAYGLAVEAGWVAYGGPWLDSGAGFVYLFVFAEGEWSTSDTTSSLEGSSSSQLGTDVLLSDIDADGEVDLIVGAPGTNQALLFYGPISGTLTTASADASVTGSYGSGTGTALATGDTDGNGAVDLIIGAPDDDQAFLFYGPLSGALSTASADASVTGSSGSGTGTALATGDTDGNGAEDILLGAPKEDGVGGSFLFLGLNL